MINKTRLIKLLTRLIAIKSENPPGDEFEIARFVRRYLLGFGVASRIYEFKKRRSNVVAMMGVKADRRGEGASLLITPHLDTVPAGKGWHTDPFKALLKNGKVYGLGATDCKGNLAVALEVMQSLTEDKAALDYALIFAATANEESGSDFGLVTLLNKGILDCDAAVVLDADAFEIVVTQKGLLHVKLKVEGKRSHGAYPWLGVNAVDITLKILDELKAQRPEFRRNPYLRPPTINIGTIRGGDKVNVVADWCECELDFRFLPGSKAEDLLRMIRKICLRRAKRFSIETEGIQKPYAIDVRHPLIAGLKAAARSVGARSQLTGSEGATVITFFHDKKIPAVATGYGAEGRAHCVDEFAAVESLYRGARVLERFLRSWNTAGRSAR
ncbi:MAG: ArgE/DapE family deacylase [Candidatus Omnitrophica bacterium]|nr:ArgE/DapE family deacylase [Candidatus Omnitrophota bacterium]